MSIFVLKVLVINDKIVQDNHSPVVHEDQTVHINKILNKTTKKLPVRLTSNNTETAHDSNTNQIKVF